MTTSMRPKIPWNFKGHMHCESTWVRLAGVGGLTALILNHYSLQSDSLGEEKKQEVSRAVRYQMLASVLIVALPNGRPFGVPKGLMCLGTLIFCGSSYLRAFFDYSCGYTPIIGAVLYGLAWGSMILVH